MSFEQRLFLAFNTTSAKNERIENIAGWWDKTNEFTHNQNTVQRILIKIHEIIEQFNSTSGHGNEFFSILFDIFLFHV